MTWLTCGKLGKPYRGHWQRRTTPVCSYMLGHQGRCSFAKEEAA